MITIGFETKSSSDLDMMRRPELKSDEFFVSKTQLIVDVVVVEILSCEHSLFTVEKLLPFIGASIRAPAPLNL